MRNQRRTGARTASHVHCDARRRTSRSTKCSNSTMSFAFQSLTWLFLKMFLPCVSVLLQVVLRFANHLILTLRSSSTRNSFLTRSWSFVFADLMSCGLITKDLGTSCLLLFQSSVLLRRPWSQLWPHTLRRDLLHRSSSSFACRQ